ncbi:MAG: beta strand repeat-containing protein [Bacteroidota bacterium]|jgi:hypothetical protein
MKKFYFSAVASLIGFLSFAQSAFFTPTGYRGAFAPAPTPMWTEGWANWDPQNTVYPAPTVTVNTNINTNTTWTSNNTYLISGVIYVRNGATLTIQPGTKILGDKNVANTCLVITVGSKINAAGTATNPIVFTSNQPVGSRNLGDWGGLIILGKGLLNVPGDTANIEGLAPTADTRYGGGLNPDDNDNSGTLSYVRVEFGGYVFAPNKEINGITFGGVGRSTTVNNVQVSFTNDDAFEWFGGAVNGKNLVSYRNLDDDFDADNGYKGNVQFGLVVRDPALADNPTVSTSEGFETDNDASGTTNAPLTSGIFSNITIIGPYRGNTANTIASGFRRAARIRRNSNLKIFNSIFMDFPRGLHIDGALCEAAIQNGGIKFKNNLIAGTLTGRVCEVNVGSTLNLQAVFAANGNDSLVSTAGILTNPYNYTSPDYRPVASPALTGSSFTDPSLASFIPTSYRGAFQPAPVTMWTDGWANWDPQNTVYPAPTVTVNTNITSNTTWTSNNTYLLSGLVYVKNGATLTIQPGTKILGDKNVANTSLIITQGSKIIAQGTSTNPIVFTSNQAAGSRNVGDWGGLIILGKAQLNVPGDSANIEGIAPSPDTKFGGSGNPNDNDNSGILSYVRVEFGGYVFAPNKEINGITFGAVGKGTTVDHVQVSFTNDDAFEWFGGSVNCSHLISYRNLDDDFDTDNGYKGFVQFGLIVRDPSLADNPTVSTSEGFESDNDPSGTTNSPLTQGIFSNITIIGPYRGNTASSIATGFRRAARIRRNSNLKIFNSIFMDFPRGLHIDGTACEANIQNGAIKFKNNLVAGVSTGKVCEVNVGSTLNLKSIFAANANDSLVSTTNILTTPYNYTAPDYRPFSGIPSVFTTNFTDPAFNGLILCSIGAPVVSGATAFCAGGNTTLTAYPSGYTYNWSTGASTQTVSINNAGNYTVTITDNLGCSSQATVAVTSNPLPTVSVSGSTAVCAGNSTTLTASGANTYFWNTGVSTASVTLSPSAVTTYTVTGTNASGCSNTQTVTINVNPLPVVNISGNNSVCNGSSSTLTGSGASTYSWNTGSTNNPLIVTPASTTAYTVTGTDANNCSNTATVTLTVNPLPNVTVSGNTTICSGQSTTLTASGANAYTWNTGFPSAALNVNPTTATSYTVTGTDANNCSNTATVSVNVNSIPVLSTTPSVTNASCGNADGSITGLTVTGNGGTLNYDWQNASNVSVGNASDLQNVVAGVYNLSVTDANSCVAVFGPYSINNPGAPAAPAISINDSTVCEGQSVSLNATTTGSNVTYQWSGAGGLTSSTQNPTFSNLTSANSGLISVTATENNCTSVASQINLIVNSAPSVGVGASSNNVCSGASVITLTGSPAGGNYSGTGVSGASFFPSISGTGTYTVTYNYTDANGCANSGTTVITVNANPNVSSSAANSSVCLNSTVNALTGTPVGGTFTGAGINGNNFNASLAGVGTFTLTYNYTDNNSCSGSSTTVVTVNGLPSVALAASNNTVCQQDGAVTLIGVPSGGTYSGTGVTGSSFNPATAGTGSFVVTYTYNDANNCSNSSTTNITVNACIGIEESISANELNVFPNPANDVLNMTFSGSREDLKFSLMNGIGQVLMTDKSESVNNINENTIQMNVNELSNGVYFLNVSDNNSNVKTIRVVVNK